MNENLFYKIEGYMKIFYYSILIMNGTFAKYWSATIFLMALRRTYGMPIFSKDYLAKLLKSEFTANLIYLIAVSSSSFK